MALQSKVILILGHDASLTGAPKSLLLISSILKSEGYKLVFILGKAGPLINKYYELGRTYIWNIETANASIFEKILFRFIGGIKNHHQQIINKIKILQPFIIFNNTVVNGDIIEKLLVLKIPVISRIPELESIIQYFDINNKSASKILKNSNRIIAVSHSVKKNLINNHLFPVDKIDVIYGAVPFKEIPLKRDSEIFRVISCGTLIQRKGIDVFIRIGKICNDLLGPSKIKFIWIGGDKKTLSYFELQEDIRKLNLADVIEITGEISDPGQYYTKGDLFLLPSREDPFPLVMLEAAQYALPIVTFQNSGGAEEFVGNDIGFCIPYLDVDAMASKVIELCENQKLCRQLGEAAKIKVKNFSEEKLKLDVLRFFKKYE